MKEFWNERYSDADYAYGKDPNVFFKEFLTSHPVTGKALFPAEGEGRNAVYGAVKGLECTAFDMSIEGQKKALQLAEEHNITIDYLVDSLENLDFEAHSFDLIVLIFAHFPPGCNETYYKKLSRYLKKGGYIIAEVFSKDHLQYSAQNPLAGGPKNKDMLFTVNDFKAYFPNFTILQLEQKDIELDEGLFHKGKASVIRFIGTKK